ncbi:MAG: DUF488 family protein [Nitrospirota bacterium]|jgi:uncharacterized protein YeaO (DUF488 family)
MPVKVKRVYEKPAGADGRRVLVDRVWPRGMKKEEAALDLWLKEVAPSTALRKWYGHDPEKWEEFKARYFKELKKKEEEIRTLRNLMNKGTLTLLFGSKEEKLNNAAALREYLKNKS